MAASLERAGQANGIRFNGERRVHNTIRSHRLVRFADAQGKGDQMIEQLFHGYFEEGKNIADVGVLLELAQKVNNTTADTRRYRRLGQEQQGQGLCPSTVHIPCF